MKYLVLVYVLVSSLFTKGYMSTRLTAKGKDTLESNVARSYSRAKQCGRVMNPALINTPRMCRILSTWGHHEYMWVWNITLAVYAYMGKPMYVYACDHDTSRGCKEEMDRALSLGMTIIYMVD